MTRAKQTIFQIINNITTQYKDLAIRVAFVGYRDFCDKEQYAIMDFTQDIKSIQDFIQSQRAMGGGDGPEDVEKTSYNIFWAISSSNHKEQWEEEMAQKML